MAFNADGHFLATGDLNGVIYIYDVTKDTAVTCLHFDSAVAVTALLWVGGSHLWVAASDGSVTMWEFRNKIVSVAGLVLIRTWM